MACTSCVITRGIKQNCQKDNIGGLSNTMYLIDRCKIESITYTGKIVTDITEAVGAEWFIVGVKKFSLNWTQSFVEANSAFNQQLVFDVQFKSDETALDEAYADTIDFIDQLANADSGIVALVQRPDGQWFLFGDSAFGLTMTAGESTSGAAQTDVPANSITLSGLITSHARPVDAAVIAALPKSNVY